MAWREKRQWKGSPWRTCFMNHIENLGNVVKMNSYVEWGFVYHGCRVLCQLAQRGTRWCGLDSQWWSSVSHWVCCYACMCACSYNTMGPHNLQGCIPGWGLQCERWMCWLSRMTLLSVRRWGGWSWMTLCLPETEDDLYILTACQGLPRGMLGWSCWAEVTCWVVL